MTKSKFVKLTIEIIYELKEPTECVPDELPDAACELLHHRSLGERFGILHSVDGGRYEVSLYPPSLARKRMGAA